MLKHSGHHMLQVEDEVWWQLAISSLQVQDHTVPHYGACCQGDRVRGLTLAGSIPAAMYRAAEFLVVWARLAGSCGSVICTRKRAVVSSGALS